VKASSLVQFDGPSVDILEPARTFVPGWWRRAFELAVTHSKETASTEFGEGSVLPRLDGVDLSLLSILLGELQSQVLKSPQSLDVEIDWAAVQKNLSKADFASKERMLRLLEVLSQIRFFARGHDEKLYATPFFAGEAWSIDSKSRAVEKIRLKLADQSVELLTGYVDAHLDFLRRANGASSLSTFNGGFSPLVLWTPVWLELSLPEQLVYARMESAMQTDGSWLRLDGLVGASVQNLTDGIKASKKSIDIHGQRTQSPLMENLRLLGRLGRKLVAHGVVKKAPDRGYMALDDNSEGPLPSPLLLWQASAERLKSRAESDFFAAVSSRIMAGLTGSQISGVFELFAELSGDRPRYSVDLGKLWSGISSIPCRAVRLPHGMMIQGHFLFLEWLSRLPASSLVPLPQDVRNHSIVESLKSVSAENVAVKFRHFLDVLRQSESLSTLMKKQTPDTLFSIASGPLDSRILERLEEAIRSAEKRRHSEGLSARTMSFGSMATGLPANRISVKLESAEVSEPKSQRNELLAQKMRRLAQDELEKMIRQSPGMYGELKGKYISSLDPETKSLVLNVQRRLDSRDFDRHLKARLVRFMIDNPASWNSVNSMFPI